MTTFHLDTQQRLRDDIAGSARRLDPPGTRGVPAVIMGTDATGVAPGAPSRMKDAR